MRKIILFFIIVLAFIVFILYNNPLANIVYYLLLLLLLYIDYKGRKKTSTHFKNLMTVLIRLFSIYTTYLLMSKFLESYNLSWILKESILLSLLMLIQFFDEIVYLINLNSTGYNIRVFNRLLSLLVFGVVHYISYVDERYRSFFFNDSISEFVMTRALMFFTVVYWLVYGLLESLTILFRKKILTKVNKKKHELKEIREYFKK